MTDHVIFTMQAERLLAYYWLIQRFTIADKAIIK